MKTMEYRTIDKSTWGEGEWQNEPDKKQWQDEETNYPCLIVRSPVSGSLCGYVGVSEGHALFGKSALYSSERESALDDLKRMGELPLREPVDIPTIQAKVFAIFPRPMITSGGLVSIRLISWITRQQWKPLRKLFRDFLSTPKYWKNIGISIAI